MATDLEAATQTATLGAVGVPRSNRAYVLVIEDGSSHAVPLASPGVATVGRVPEAEIRVDHSSVSRRHARIMVDHGEIRIADLDSHNGTRVNGVRIDGARVLMTGDVVAIGEVLLVVHADLERELSHVILDEIGRASCRG